MNRNVPDGWSLTRVSEIATVTSGGTPDRTNAAFYSGVNPWIKSGEVNQRTIRHTEEHISDDAIENSSAKWVNAGAVLVAMYGATAGKVAKLMINATLNQAIAAVVLKRSGFCSDYLFHSLEFSSDELLKSLQGSGQPNLSGGLIKELKLLSPPLPEQQKIASILTAIDEVIESTTAQINKLKDLKTGMMQELLTKGIGHTEFKDSPVGRIPKAWAVKKLDDISINLDSKRVPIKSTDRAEVQGQYPYYGASGIIDYVSDYIFDGEYILLGEDGENVLSRNLPLAFIVKGKSWVNNHAHVLQAKLGTNLKFLCEYLESLDYKNIASGSAQPKITKGALSEIYVPVPSIDEQVKIADILTSIDEKLSQKKSKLDHHQKMKKGLMQDLLSGKVRVNAY